MWDEHFRIKLLLELLVYVRIYPLSLYQLMGMKPKAAGLEAWEPESPPASRCAQYLQLQAPLPVPYFDLLPSPGR